MAKNEKTSGDEHADDQNNAKVKIKTLNSKCEYPLWKVRTRNYMMKSDKHTWDTVGNIPADTDNNSAFLVSVIGDTILEEILTSLPDDASAQFGSNLCEMQRTWN